LNWKNVAPDSAFPEQGSVLFLVLIRSSQIIIAHWLLLGIFVQKLFETTRISILGKVEKI